MPFIDTAVGGRARSSGRDLPARDHQVGVAPGRATRQSSRLLGVVDLGSWTADSLRTPAFRWPSSVCRCACRQCRTGRSVWPTSYDVAMQGEGVHHLYVETYSLERSVAFWEAVGFKIDPTFSGREDAILRASSGPYVFLRVVDHGEPLRFDVVLAADDLETVAQQAAVRVLRPLYDTAWGAQTMDIADPDDRPFNVRKNDGW